MLSHAQQGRMYRAEGSRERNTLRVKKRKNRGEVAAISTDLCGRKSGIFPTYSGLFLLLQRH